MRVEFMLTLLLASAGLADERWAPHAVAGPVNQLDVAGNACGPAALLASFRCGSEKWRAIPERIPGASDRSKLLYIIRAHGLCPSNSLKNRNRWTNAGINAEDLAEIAGELAAIGRIPKPSTESMLLKSRESPESLVKRVHDRLQSSLVDGFPPVLSLRRYVLRKGNWEMVQGHFVTVVMVPEKLPRGARQFDFTYFDPWGGKKVRGVLGIPLDPVLSIDAKTSSCLEASVPSADIGRSKVRADERSAVVPTMATGHW